MVAVVLVLVAAGSGVAAGAVLVPAAPPAAISPSTGPLEVPVRTVDFDGASPASLNVTPGEAAMLSAQTAGRVTSTRCTVGAELASGTSVVSVNDRPLLLLATARPLWRDLGSGDSGDDVRALQEELRRLGASVTVDGRFGPTTLRAVRAVAEAAGAAAAEWSTLPADQVVWLPAPIVHAASCPAKLGDTIAVGAAIAVLPSRIASARLAAPPADAAEHPRVIRIDDAAIPLEADGRVGSAEGLDALAATPSFQAALQASSGGGDRLAAATDGTPRGSSGADLTVDGELTLAKPFEALVVPPGALYRLSGDRGCVVAAGTARDVRILGSQLGKTFIEKPRGTTIRQVTLRPVGAPPCR
jgi:peptidoglycan hydrolase-like protein with peptidoglycan-binding domain